MSVRGLLVATTEFAPYRGGVGTYAQEMARAASQLGWNTTVWAPDYGVAPSEYWDEKLRVLRYPGGVADRKDLPRLVLQFAAACTRLRPDTIILCSWPDSLCAAALHMYRFSRCVVMCHGTELLNLPYGRVSRLLGYRRLIARAQVVACNSQFTASLISRAGLKPGGSVRVTPLAASKFWCEAVDPGRARQRWNIPDSHLILSTVGRLDWRKGQDLVLEALALLDTELQRAVTYVIVGPEVEADHVARLRARAEQIVAKVIFTNSIPDDEVRDVYAASDLLVLTGRDDPSRVEGFGLVLLEAASQGVPSLVTKVGGVPEVVADGITGEVLAAWAPSDIAKALGALLRDKGRLERMGAAARERAVSFSWLRTAELTLA